MEYDPYSYEQDLDPYPIYRWMQDEAPAYHNPTHGFWALTRFEDCHRAFVDNETYSSARGTVLELMDAPRLPPVMIFMDPPSHTAVRNLVAKAFTPRRIAAMEPQIREIASGHLDPLLGRARFDAVREFSARLPMDVISALLGIPPLDRDAVRGWSNLILHRDADRPEPPPAALEAQENLMRYFGEALAERRKRPRDDMMSDLIRAELRHADGSLSTLSDLDLVSFFNLLATAGNETVTKLLATVFWWLWKNPDQRALLVERPELIPGAVEETVRYDPPSQYQGRVTTREVRLHGEVLPEGAKVLVINGASGRDARAFEEPDRYDVRRRIEFHLGFGFARHICLGASLARLESRVALEEFLRRFPAWEIPADGVERMHSSNVRGFGGLVLEPAA